MPRLPWDAVVNVGSELRSPQSMSTDHGSSLTPGSLNEPRLKACAAPSFEDWALGAVSVGATLSTVTVVV